MAKLLEPVFAKNAVFIDVRSPEEVAQPPLLPHPFINIPVGMMKESEIELPPFKNTPIVVYCRSGHRSETAKFELESLNYTNVINGGGIYDVISVMNSASPISAAESEQPKQQSQTGTKPLPKNQGELSLLCELSGHSDTVWCAVWSPNGKYIASCGSDIIINIWGKTRNSNSISSDWVLLATLDEGQQRTIRNVSWSPCGKYISSVSFDGTCAVWEHQINNENTENVGQMEWELIVQLEGHENEVKSVSWNNDGSLLATCGRDKSIWIWEAIDLSEAEFECLSVLQEHTQDVKCIKFHPNGIGNINPLPMLVSASYDDSLKIWGEDGDDWICCQTLVGHSSSVWCLAFGPNPTNQPNHDKDDDNKMEQDEEKKEVNVNAIISVSDDNSMILWTKPLDETSTTSSLSGWSISQKISQAHSRSLYSVDWERTSHHAIATCGADNAIRIFKTSLKRAISNNNNNKNNDEEEDNGDDQSTTDILKPIELDIEIEHAHDGDVNSVAWSPIEPNLLVSAGDDAIVRVWSYKEN